MRKLTLSEAAEYTSLLEREDDLLSYHKLYVSNFFEVLRTKVRQDIQSAREDIEFVEQTLSRLHLLKHATGGS